MLLLWSCGANRHDHESHHEETPGLVLDHEGEDPHEHEAVHGHEESGNSDEIVLPAEKAAAAGVETETVAPAPFSGVIKTGGQILPAQGDEMTVVAVSDGLVSFEGNYAEGSELGKGQPLFSIISGNIQDGNRIGKARVAYESAKAEYERAAALVGSRIVSRKEFVRIKENYENARMAYEALKPNEDGTGVMVESPSDGFVKSLLVKEGDYVAVGAPLAVVSQTKRLVLRADVSQRYFSRLGTIVSANFMTPYANEVHNIASLGGRLLSYGRSASESTHYIPVTFEFDNRDGVVPGSFAEVWLLTAERENVISLPVSAITEEQGLYFVYVKIDDSCYRKQEVSLGESDGSRTEILSGVRPGDNVVVKGAYNVKLASASNAIPAHTHNH